MTGKYRWLSPVSGTCITCGREFPRVYSKIYCSDACNPKALIRRDPTNEDIQRLLHDWSGSHGRCP